MNSVELALKMETDAVNFYTEASGMSGYPAGSRMFLSIAQDEKRHIEMLNRLLRNIDLTLQESNPVKTVKTIFEEMKDKMMQRVKASDDDMEAFRIAMQMEKEGVEFYKKAAEEAGTDKERMLFDMLILEEEKHYQMFSNTYSFMTDTGNWFMWEERSIVEG
ncbi:MAG: ferritin family protein [Nitrospiraceae bacterium]|nr:ferritin family protein [Nitrospiraceae bacterium]